MASKYPDYPKKIQPYLVALSESIGELMLDLKSGKITPNAWYEQFSELIAMFNVIGYHATAKKTPTGEAFDWLTGNVAAQLSYLQGFRDTITATMGAEGEWPATWDARAEMYTTSIIAPFWYGETKGLPIPALPGDGSSQCGSRDRCEIRIDWEDEETGTADVYWLLDPEADGRHCQTCEVRADEWNPLHFEDWTMT